MFIYSNLFIFYTTTKIYRYVFFFCNILLEQCDFFKGNLCICVGRMNIENTETKICETQEINGFGWIKKNINLLIREWPEDFLCVGLFYTWHKNTEYQPGNGFLFGRIFLDRTFRRLVVACSWKRNRKRNRTRNSNFWFGFGSRFVGNFWGVATYNRNRM